MIRNFIQTVFGILTFIPGVYSWRASKLGSGGSYSSRYCYTVWMRHIVLAKKSNLNYYPEVVAELGPGDSLGVGIMALLLGSDKYVACDVVEFTNTKKNLVILEELLVLLKSRDPIPDDHEFPRVIPKLDDYSFPADIYSDEHLRDSLSNERVKKIRASLSSQKLMIEYNHAWLFDLQKYSRSFDMVLSQAVLEHVDDLKNVYAMQKNWLRIDGFISHSIDFKSHAYAPTWDGHWKISKWRWFLLRGNRPYMINREPLSRHTNILKNCGFNLVNIDNYRKDPTLLSKQYKTNLSLNDKHVSDSFIQANISDD
jgi:hypothetical protein